MPGYGDGTVDRRWHLVCAIAPIVACIGSGNGTVLSGRWRPAHDLGRALVVQRCPCDVDAHDYG